MYTCGPLAIDNIYFLGFSNRSTIFRRLTFRIQTHFKTTIIVHDVNSGRNLPKHVTNVYVHSFLDYP